MKKHFILRAAALIACLAVAIPHIFAYSFKSAALFEEDVSYSFDSGVDDELKRAISKRIFEEDFNGIAIDLADLDIPDTEQNHRAVETLIKFGLPFYDYRLVRITVCGWTVIIDGAERAHIAECQCRADELLLGIAGNDSLTDAEKAYLIHERLRAACEYDYDCSEKSEYSYEPAYSAYGALMLGCAVCDGYARAYMYLCRRAGLECYYEDGLSTEKENSGHAWNVIYLDGDDGVRRPYYVDVTWADSAENTERYFLKGYPNFSDTHWNYESVMYPGAARDMMPEEYLADDPGASRPKAALVYCGEWKAAILVSSRCDDVEVYFGRSETPQDGDFVRLEQVFPDIRKYFMKTDGPGTYFAAAKDEYGTSDVVSLVITEDFYTDAGSYTVHITKTDPDAVFHPWSEFSYYTYIVFEEKDLSAIPANAFCGFSTLQDFAIPDSVSKIGAYAFSGCSFTDGIDLPAGVTSIGEYAFKKCYFGLEGKIKIPDRVDRINEGAFSDCTGLYDLTLSEDLKVIERDAFSGCKYLDTLIFKSVPDSVDKDAFAGCDSLETVSLVSDAGFTLTIPVK